MTEPNDELTIARIQQTLDWYKDYRQPPETAYLVALAKSLLASQKALDRVTYAFGVCVACGMPPTIDHQEGCWLAAALLKKGESDAATPKPEPGPSYEEWHNRGPQ